LYFFILEKRELRTDQMGCGGSKAAQVSLVKVKQIEDRPSGQDEPDPWVYAQVRFEKITLALKNSRSVHESTTAHMRAHNLAEAMITKDSDCDAAD
jgi:hypothetical protein